MNIINAENHETSEIIIKKAQIDKKIQPLIEWLNGFKDIQTEHCCEGGGSSINKPYVVFRCSSNLTLLVILARTMSFSNTEVEYYGGGLRYIMRFEDCKILEDFQKLILDGGANSWYEKVEKELP